MDKTATNQILAELKALHARLDKIECGPEGMGACDQRADLDDDEAVLAQMVEEEEMVEDDGDDVEAMLRSMVEEEMVEDVVVGDDEVDVVVEEEAVVADDFDDFDDDVEMNIDLAPVDDPMGFLDEDIMDDGDDALLSSLFADSRLAGDDDDDDDDSDDGEEVVEAKKKASQKPRAKKASAGPQRLGGVTATGDTSDADLEKLWPTAPDVSKVFG